MLAYAEYCRSEAREVDLEEPYGGVSGEALLRPLNQLLIGLPSQHAFNAQVRLGRDKGGGGEQVADAIEASVAALLGGSASVASVGALGAVSGAAATAVRPTMGGGNASKLQLPAARAPNTDNMGETGRRKVKATHSCSATESRRRKRIEHKFASPSNWLDTQPATAGARQNTNPYAVG